VSDWWSDPTRIFGLSKAQVLIVVMVGFALFTARKGRWLTGPVPQVVLNIAVGGYFLLQGVGNLIGPPAATLSAHGRFWGIIGVLLSLYCGREVWKNYRRMNIRK
jgi:hypothetical protein